MRYVNLIILILVSGLLLAGCATPQVKKETLPGITEKDKKTEEKKDNDGTEVKRYEGILCANASYDNLNNTPPKSNDPTKEPSTDFSKCNKYKPLFQKYMDQENLTGKIDLLMVYALTMQESSCMNADELGDLGRATADGGIMQVDDACLNKKNCDTVDREIEEGIKELKIKYENFSSKKLSHIDKLTLILFSYNRGLKTANDALEKMETENLNIVDAMEQSCRAIYKQEGKGCLYCKYDKGGVDKCNGPGYGIEYYPKIFSYFADACAQANGTVTDLIIERSAANSSTIKIGTPGNKTTTSPTQATPPPLDGSTGGTTDSGQSAQAQSNSAIIGKWSGTFSFTNNCPNPSCKYVGRSNPDPVTVTIKQKDGKLEGTLYSNPKLFDAVSLDKSHPDSDWCPTVRQIGDGESEIYDIAIDGSKLKFYDVADNLWELELKDNKLSGKITGTGEGCVGMLSNDVIFGSAGVLDGKWAGTYTETETVSNGCVNHNKGNLIMVLSMDRDSFTGTVEDTGSAETTNGGEACVDEGSGYHYAGTVSGKLDGNKLTGTMILKDPQVTFTLPFNGMLQDDSIKGTYTGTGTYDGGSSTYDGSFSLNR